MMRRFIIFFFLLSCFLANESQSLPPLEEVCLRPSVACRLFPDLDEVDEEESASDAAAETVVVDGNSHEEESASVDEDEQVYTGRATEVPQFRLDTLEEVDTEATRIPVCALRGKFVMLNLDEVISVDFFSDVQMLGANFIKKENIAYFAKILEITGSLKHLYIGGFDEQKTMDAVLGIVQDHGEGLTGLTISGFSPKGFCTVKMWPAIESLQHLSIEKIGLSGKLEAHEVANAFPALRSLTAREVVYSVENREMFAVHFSRLRNLERLEVIDLVDLSMFSFIGSLNSIKYILLSDMEFAHAPGTGFGKNGMLPFLEKAPFSSTNVTLTISDMISFPWLECLISKMRISVLDTTGVCFEEELREGSTEAVLLEKWLRELCQRDIRLMMPDTVEDEYDAFLDRIVDADSFIENATVEFYE